MSEEVLHVTRDGRVATVTLNRPASKNALNPALVAALAHELTKLGDDAGVGAIVLTGAGDAFCSGADLKAALMDPSAMGDIEARLERFHDIIRAVVGAPQPVLAAVDGPAVGFGCDLALACDLRVGTERAYFQEKFVRIGLVPDGGGSLWLPQMIGVGRALELMLLGEPVEGRRALELGLVNKLVAPELLMPTTLELARRIAAGPPIANTGIKRSVRASLTAVALALGHEKEAQLRCLHSQDFLEGTMAWMQKREPVFSGN
ncbi:MAG: enoyl-CoA hydratase [Myxococcales bacterium]|nr:enoyl-CoA hydratase [Myxococcales bacterium]